MEEQIPVMSTLLALSALSTVLLSLCLAHTWKYWRQVKWYIILLTVGLLLNVGFTQGFTLSVFVSQRFPGSTATCRLMVLMFSLGPSLCGMAVAALALHVLLTCITGCQGDRLRHALVMGLFVLLSLPVPFSKLAFSEARTFNTGTSYETNVCMTHTGSQEEQLQLHIGDSVATVFFPLFVTLLCCVAAAILLAASSRHGNVKGDADKSDLILAALLGTSLMVFYVPYHIASLVAHADSMLHAGSALAMYEVMMKLDYLLDCFPIGAALITIVFAYTHACRNRREFLVASGGDQSSASGERQKLVN
ncbi:uncharacterized protein LOC143296940 [Babylonia areolata]|uniref:uncharacterized protein LOC143296940 n=1 Tax=Babylonia areolata TaxID=304850 RepID=UPI003FD188FD